MSSSLVENVVVVVVVVSEALVLVVAGTGGSGGGDSGGGALRLTSGVSFSGGRLLTSSLAAHKYSPLTAVRAGAVMAAAPEIRLDLSSNNTRARRWDESHPDFQKDRDENGDGDDDEEERHDVRTREAFKSSHG